jgi:hypothetical protein
VSSFPQQKSLRLLLGIVLLVSSPSLSHGIQGDLKHALRARRAVHARGAYIAKLDVMF